MEDPHDEFDIWGTQPSKFDETKPMWAWVAAIAAFAILLVVFTGVGA